MKNINDKGLLIAENLLLNYYNFGLTDKEFILLLQLSYLTEQGKNKFDLKAFSDMLNISENVFFESLDSLIKKEIIFIDSNHNIHFNLLSSSDNYFSLRALLQYVEKVNGRILSSKDIDIVSMWISKKYTKDQIIDAFKISNNINYVNAILENKPVESKSFKEDDIINYDWLNH